MNGPLKYHEIPIPVADTSKSYRHYLSEHYYETSCPECGGLLGQKYSVGVISIETEHYASDNIILLDRYSYFCSKCPVVVISSKVLKQVINEGIEGERTVRYRFDGLINLDALPDDQRDFELLGKNGSKPPIVPFLPSLKKKAPKKS